MIADETLCTACARCGATLSMSIAGGLCPACLLDTTLIEEETPEPLREGRWFGDYELLEELGRGGMGVVYRARHSELSRVVALKMVLPTHLHAVVERTRFQRETEAIASLDHPHILPIYEVGEHGGQPFFTMKLCAHNLAEGSRIPDLKFQIPDNAARLVADLARAVHYAHERGIQHRDLKPGNVLLDADGLALVSDFGLAKFRDRDSTLTVSATVLGSPAYMAPEIARGEARDVTNAADVYSLGAILYELLAARPPFHAGSALEVMRMVVEMEPVAPRSLNPAIPRDLETICLKCLRKNPAARYASARELAEDLERFLAGKTVNARPVSTVERLWRWCRRRPIVAVLLAVLALGAVASVWQIEAARRAQSRETVRAEKISDRLGETNLALSRTNTQLSETIDYVELQRAEDFFRAGDSGQALLLLAQVLERNPDHQVAGARLASALLHGGYARPAGSPFAPGGPVVHLETMRDGTTLFLATEPGLAGLWDAASGEQRLAFQRAGHPLSHAKILGDGSVAAGWEARGNISLWNTDTGELSAPTIRLGSAVAAGAVPQPQGTMIDPENAWRIAFSPDGKRFAAGAGATVRVWNTHAAQPIFALPPLPPPVQQLAFSPDDRWLVVAAGDGAVHRFAAANGKVARPTIRHEGEIRSLHFSKDGRWLLSAGSDRAARIWDADTGAAAAPAVHHRDWINAAIFSPDGERVATVSGDYTARIWETRTGLPLWQPLPHLQQPLTAAFSQDRDFFYTAGDDEMVRRWDLRAGGARAAFLHTGDVNDAVFSRDGRLIATAAEDGHACIWSADSFQPVWSAEVAGATKLVRFDPTRRWLAFAEGAKVRVQRFDAPESARWSFEHNARVLDLCFSRDGKQLATASLDKTARIWNLDDGTAATAPLKHESPVVSVRFSPSGHTLLTAQATGKSAQLWDVRTGQQIGRPMIHQNKVTVAEFSPDGTLIATASSDDDARVWDAATSAPVTPALRHRRTVESVAFSPDGLLLATASWDGTAQIWDARTGQPVTRAMQHEDYVFDVRFSPDGRRLATASTDKTARLWDTATGLPVTEPLPHASPVRRVRFSPNGQRLLTLSDGSPARVWEVPEFTGKPPAWLAAAARALAADKIPVNSTVTDAAVTGFARAQAQAEADPGEGHYARLARWFFHGRREGDSFTAPWK